MDDLQEFISEHTEWSDQVAYLAVGIDPTLESAKKHLASVEAEEGRSWKRTINTWHDAQGGESPVYQAYAARTGVPVSYIVDRKGVIVAIDSPSSDVEVDLAKELSALLGP